MQYALTVNTICFIFSKVLAQLTPAGGGSSYCLVVINQDLRWTVILSHNFDVQTQNLQK